MTIRNIIQQGQDTLTRMGRGKARADSRWEMDVTLSAARLNRPLSFGELSIALVQEKIQEHAGDGHYIAYLLVSGIRPIKWPLLNGIRDLLVAMYHKEKE